MTKRYVNIYDDPEIPGVRFISDNDHDSRVEAETWPVFDREHVRETVRLLSKQEEGELEAQLKELDGLRWGVAQLVESMVYVAAPRIDELEASDRDRGAIKQLFTRNAIGAIQDVRRRFPMATIELGEAIKAIQTMRDRF